MNKLSRGIQRFRTLQTPSALNLPFAVHPLIRLAQLDEDAPAFGSLQAYRPQSAIDLEGFRPNIIVGGSVALHSLAEQAELATVNLACLDHAVIALTPCGCAPLNDVSRVVFWQAFGVPVYEVFTGMDQSILGFECELHDGWHLAAHVQFALDDGELLLNAGGNAGLQTSLTGLVTDEPCPCGRAGRRLLNIEPVPRLNLKLKWAAIA